MAMKRSQTGRWRQPSDNERAQPVSRGQFIGLDNERAQPVGRADLPPWGTRIEPRGVLSECPSPQRSEAERVSILRP